MPNNDEADILADPGQHDPICPGCRGKRTHLVPGTTQGEFFMGCDDCGHVWVGKDFDQHEAETPTIPE